MLLRRGVFVKFPVIPASQPYERCSFEGKKVQKMIMPSFLSSQCVTLGSKYKNICELCNEQQILGTYNVNSENKMDPSVTHWDDREKSTGMTR